MVSDRGRNVNNVGIWLCFDELLIWNVHNQMNLFIDNSRVIAEKYSIAIRYRCQRYFLQLLVSRTITAEGRPTSDVNKTKFWRPRLPEVNKGT